MIGGERKWGVRELGEFMIGGGGVFMRILLLLLLGEASAVGMVGAFTSTESLIRRCGLLFLLHSYVLKL